MGRVKVTLREKPSANMVEASTGGLVTVQGGGFVQELWFAWLNGAWVFAGGEMWEGTADAKGRWLWTLEHDRHEKVGDVLLPARTKVRAPGQKRPHLIVIAYKERTPNPPWAESEADTDDPGGADDAGGADDGGWENTEDGGWENTEDGGWENADDGGWENEEPASSDDEAPAPSEAPAPPSGALAAVIQAAAPASTAPTHAAPIPAVFEISPAGLTERGDLCR